MRKETAVKDEQSQIEISLRNMYELGKKHGYELAIEAMKIEKLSKEVEELQKATENA